MEEEKDIRWKQRFENYEMAFRQFQDAVLQYKETDSRLIQEGIIQRFEFTHELAWKVMKDFLTYEGIQGIIGSRSAVREAFNKDLIYNGEAWIAMIETRNRTVHIYDADILHVEYHKITDDYFPLMEDFYKKMKTFL